MQQIDFVFWPASARAHGFRGHVQAAQAGGFTSLAIAPETYLEALESGLRPEDMRKMAEDAGAPLRYLDSLTDWAPIRVPAECSQELRARFDVSTDHNFRICEKLGLTSILAVAGYDKGTVELSRLVDGFGKLCDRAKQHSYWIDLEFMPFWGLPNLSDAWAIINGVNPSNAGILVDVWHFSKGQYELDLLRSLPGHFFAGMQIDDGRKSQVGRSMFEDTDKYRNFPGEGEMDVVEVIKTVAQKGHLRHAGPEVFSLQADALSAREAGIKSAETTRWALEKAGVPVPPAPPKTAA
ncbi:sugar phosphate isomerase/epimerase [Mesorhizobium sp. M3A.F.Ca.ET.201.01.1.1]|uniref:TIM barrel protein n=1 Tax=Mesorhizobium sp. M3A.F.Ca.ET.201.01.1.1 TaxID=2563946 RepID=UPI0010933920|nr:TIM barrel protein [Mesorhizobium sp. M3A.F.Ca.ET.201.01.1.1]TGS71703.1 sugar phosphate isomerase/epimerase [Mesorhizobium sp. M3A.F.Ca.ET.201.01.1.1]